jgi:hypothetical protein
MWKCVVDGNTRSRTFSKELGVTREKQMRKTSVCG